MRITLDNGEGARVLGILHDEPCLPIESAYLRFKIIRKSMRVHSPTQTFLVVGIDLRSFLQLGDQLVDGVLVLLGIEVNDECVDHCCGDVIV